MYGKGEGVPMDSIEAYAWLNISAASGAEAAIKARNALENALGHDATLKAQERSKELLKEIEVAKGNEIKP